MIGLVLPSADTPKLTYDIALDGVDYRFKFQYLTRYGIWHLTLQTLAEVDIVSNLPLVPHYDLLSMYASADIPEGLLVLVSAYDYPSPPAVTLENLSTTYQLVYFSPEELE